jgi:hypothetical protein
MIGIQNVVVGEEVIIMHWKMVITGVVIIIAGERIVSVIVVIGAVVGVVVGIGSRTVISKGIIRSLFLLLLWLLLLLLLGVI